MGSRREWPVPTSSARRRFGESASEFSLCMTGARRTWFRQSSSTPDLEAKPTGSSKTTNSCQPRTSRASSCFCARSEYPPKSGMRGMALPRMPSVFPPKFNPPDRALRLHFQPQIHRHQWQEHASARWVRFAAVPDPVPRLPLNQSFGPADNSEQKNIPSAGSGELRAWELTNSISISNFNCVAEPVCHGPARLSWRAESRRIREICTMADSSLQCPSQPRAQSALARPAPIGSYKFPARKNLGGKP